MDHFDICEYHCWMLTASNSQKLTTLIDSRFSWVCMFVHSWICGDFAQDAALICLRLLGLWPRPRTWGRKIKSSWNNRLDPEFMDIKSGKEAGKGARANSLSARVVTVRWVAAARPGRVPNMVYCEGIKLYKFTSRSFGRDFRRYRYSGRCVLQRWLVRQWCTSPPFLAAKTRGQQVLQPGRCSFSTKSSLSIGSTDGKVARLDVFPCFSTGFARFNPFALAGNTADPSDGHLQYAPRSCCLVPFWAGVGWGSLSITWISKSGLRLPKSGTIQTGSWWFAISVAYMEFLSVIVVPTMLDQGSKG